MATVRTLGLFPFCAPIRDNIIGGVEVSKEWACAYYWRIKSIKCTSLTFSASLTVGLPWGTDSVSFSAVGGDNEIEATKKFITRYVSTYPEFDEEKDERSLVCGAPRDGAVGFFSWQPVRLNSSGRPQASGWGMEGFVAGEIVNDEATGNFIPSVTNGSVHGSISAATLTSYFFSSQSDERGPYGTNSTVAIPSLYRSFYRKSDNPETLYFKPIPLPNGIGFGLGTYVVYGASARGFDGGDAFFQDKTGIEGGSVTFKINGFDDVVIPVYYYLAIDPDFGPTKTSLSGSVSYLATIEAAEFFTYDPGDGLGPIYDSETGEQLRAFPS